MAELKASGKAGTPVTAESFAAWYEQKRQRKLEAARLLVEAELKKKKGGKGLGVLSGRALFEYKRELFQDDVGGDDDGNSSANGGDEERGEVMDLSQMARARRDEDDYGDDDQDNNSNYHHQQSNGDDHGQRDDTLSDEPADSTNGVAAQLQSHLFLQGDDDDLDDLLD
jgi:hypothetical protein